MNVATGVVNQQLQRAVQRRKLFDQLFVLVGMAILFAALLTLAILFLDLVRDGSSRFGWDFFSSFPSRKAERAGILSAWVGTSLVMLVTVAVAMPVSRLQSIWRNTRRRTGSRRSSRST
jgi:phosphate transport system permease protein